MINGPSNLSIGLGCIYGGGPMLLWTHAARAAGGGHMLLWIYGPGLREVVPETQESQATKEGRREHSQATKESQTR